MNFSQWLLVTGNDMTESPDDASNSLKSSYFSQCCRITGVVLYTDTDRPSDSAWSCTTASCRSRLRAPPSSYRGAGPFRTGRGVSASAWSGPAPSCASGPSCGWSTRWTTPASAPGPARKSHPAYDRGREVHLKSERTTHPQLETQIRAGVAHLVSRDGYLMHGVVDWLEQVQHRRERPLQLRSPLAVCTVFQQFLK